MSVGGVRGEEATEPRGFQKWFPEMPREERVRIYTILEALYAQPAQAAE